MQVALGDAIAVALLTRRGFTAADFRQIHPGGRLGARLRRVHELMHAGASMPLAPPDMPMAAALVLMTEKRFGCLGVAGADGVLGGIITDGDLRRMLEKNDSLEGITARDIMTIHPKTIAADTLAVDALNVLRTFDITQLVVTNEKQYLGVLHLHDLMREGLI